MFEFSRGPLASSLSHELRVTPSGAEALRTMLETCLIKVLRLDSIRPSHVRARRVATHAHLDPGQWNNGLNSSQCPANPLRSRSPTCAITIFCCGSTATEQCPIPPTARYMSSGTSGLK